MCFYVCVCLFSFSFDIVNPHEIPAYLPPPLPPSLPPYPPTIMVHFPSFVDINKSTRKIISVLLVASCSPPPPQPPFSFSALFLSFLFFRLPLLPNRFSMVAKTFHDNDNGQYPTYIDTYTYSHSVCVMLLPTKHNQNPLLRFNPQDNPPPSILITGSKKKEKRNSSPVQQCYKYILCTRLKTSALPPRWRNDNKRRGGPHPVGHGRRCERRRDTTSVLRLPPDIKCIRDRSPNPPSPNRDSPPRYFSKSYSHYSLRADPELHCLLHLSQRKEKKREK